LGDLHGDQPRQDDVPEHNPRQVADEEADREQPVVGLAELELPEQQAEPEDRHQPPEPVVGPRGPGDQAGRDESDRDRQRDDDSNRGIRGIEHGRGRRREREGDRKETDVEKPDPTLGHRSNRHTGFAG
jgi:hypothetical protein